MSKLRIVAADNIKGSGIAMLKEAFGADAVEVRGKYSEAELCKAVGEIDALLVRSGTTVTPKVFESGSRLRLVGRAGVGTDNIDKEAATASGVVVMNTPLGNTISAAEQALALLFATARNVARADHLMQQGKWEKKDLVGVEVFEKTLGLVGLGKIGSHVAKVMGAAGMHVLAYDPFLPADKARQLGVTLVDLDELLAKADFVSLHTPLTDKTRNLLSRERLQGMKKGVRIVNCARGGIIDEQALADLVKSGHIAAAGLDVFSEEPMTSGPLFGVKDITLTPHLGASTDEAEERCGAQMAEQVIAFFRDGMVINGVNIQMTADKTLKPYIDVAYAMGKIAGVLVNARASQVEIACSGDLRNKDTSAITASALRGVLMAYGAEDVNLVNARYLAGQRGIAISETAPGADSYYTSRIDLYIRGEGKETHVAGTAYGESPRIVQIDDADMDFKPGPHMLFLRYPDTPGYVGKFGTLIAEHGINIGNMEVGSLESRKRASMVIGLYEPATDALMDALRKVDGVERAWYVKV